MRKIVIISILLLAFLFVNVVSAANPSQDVYVAVSGSDSNNGADLNNAYATVGKAINASNENNSVNIH